MNIEKIKQELANPTYKGLLTIYNEGKINNKMDAYFASDEDLPSGHMKFNMLVKEVQTILRKALNNPGVFDQKPAVPKIDTGLINLPKKVTKKNDEKIKDIASGNPPKGKVKVDNNPHVNRADLPENLQSLYDENGKMNQKQKSLHELMKAATDDDARKGFLDEINELDETMKKNWKVIDDWYQEFLGSKGKDKKDLPVVTDNEKLIRKIETAKNYILRYPDTTKDFQLAKIKEYTEFLKANNVKVPVPKKKATGDPEAK